MFNDSPFPTQPPGSGSDSAPSSASDWEDSDWHDGRIALRGLPEGGLNIAYETLDRHLMDPGAGGLGDKTAIRWLRRDGGVESLTYAVLASQSVRLANLLLGLGLNRGDRVATLLGRSPHVHLAAMGALRAGGVFTPLLSLLGPDPLRTRLKLSDARFLITTEALYWRKIAPLQYELPALRQVLLIDARAGGRLPKDCLRLNEALAECPDQGGLIHTGADDLALLHFTSSSNGAPKAVVHAHQAAMLLLATARWVLDLESDDVLWCTADPGSMAATGYGIIAPLLIGSTLIIDEAEIDPARWLGILRDQGVNVLYTAPMALRSLMRLDPAAYRTTDLSALRVVASIGEPLAAATVRWGKAAFGTPIRDTWWQTETGGIVIANRPGKANRPGAIGQPLPGIDAAIVERPKGDRLLRLIETPDQVGELAIRSGWPSMFRGYLCQPDRYQDCFADGWYLSGELARRDEDGWFWIVGRRADVIQTAGYLIGPFEIECALRSHPAVADAAAIGIPDPNLGEIVKAIVVPAPHYRPSEQLGLEILSHTRRRLGPVIAPRLLDFEHDLPRSDSGRPLRRLLRARALGHREDDPALYLDDD